MSGHDRPEYAAFADPTVDAVYGDLVYVAKEDTSRVIRYWRAGMYGPARLRLGWMPPHPTLYLRRSLYERFGIFNTRYRIAADYDLMLRMLTKLPGRVVYLPEVGSAGAHAHRRYQQRLGWQNYAQVFGGLPGAARQ